MADEPTRFMIHVVVVVVAAAVVAAAAAAVVVVVVVDVFFLGWQVFCFLLVRKFHHKKSKSFWHENDIDNLPIQDVGFKRKYFL